MPRKAGQSAAANAKRPAADTPNRTSKRARASTRKSYDERDTDSEASARADSPGDGESGEASDFEAKSDKDLTSESEPEADASEEEPVSKKATSRRQVSKISASVHKKQATEKDLWKTGAKLEPGTQLVIKKPKAREAGDTPYTESTIHPNTMLFLEEIKENNDRQWLKCMLENGDPYKKPTKLTCRQCTIPTIELRCRTSMTSSASFPRKLSR